MRSPAPILPAFLLAVNVASHPLSSTFSWASTKNLLAFGDSYTYVQGLYGRQNYSFIGDAFNFSYTPSQLLNDTVIQNQIGTSAGGPNWVEYLTGCFEGLPAQCVGEGQKQLWDFAFAGADVSTKYLNLHHNYTVDLDNQVRQYDTYARSTLDLNPNETLVAIFIGINDINDSAKWTNVSFPDLYSSIIATMLESTSTIASNGNLQDFLFMALPPLEKTPGNVVAAAKNQTLYPSTAQVSSWNSILSTQVESWSQSQSGVRNAWVFDTYDFLNQIIEEPAAYGIANVTRYAHSGNAVRPPSEYADCEQLLSSI
ncbi:MAG: hypothetical protein Q9160_000148 [Pyrenula sp. 1 TL-2023]